MSKICILGGGASALMCAAFAKGDVTILEGSNKVGKKILASGNGRCNLSNTNMNMCSYNQNVDRYLKRFDVNKTLQFFKMLGLETYADEEGRVYPISNTATSVLNVLNNYIKLKNNIKIAENAEVFDILPAKNGYLVKFVDGEQMFFNKVVVAMGNYTNLKMFDKFEIKYKEFKPSLCALKTEKHKPLSGVRVSDVCVRCYENGINFCEVGEILFKDEGISGIVVFNLSAHLARTTFKNVNIYVDYLHKLTAEDVYNMLLFRRENLENQIVEEFLTGIFHKQVNIEILNRAKVDLNKYVAELKIKELQSIANVIKNFKLEINGFYDNNQVASGGVELCELDENLMSKKQKGLYFIGEVCNVDGVCGGYNLQWAWTSGKIVGDQI